MTRKRMTTIRLDEDQMAGLDEVKRRDGVGISEQIRRAIDQWLIAKGVRKAARPRVQPRDRA